MLLEDWRTASDVYYLCTSLAMGSPVVIETGTNWLRIGFAGDDGPRHMIPSVIGRHKVSL